MATFPTPSQVQQQYFIILQNIKPSLNVNDNNSDFVIRGNVFSGVLSGLYGDQESVDNDSFVTSMDASSLTLKGQDLGLPQLQATASESTDVQINGTNGTIITPGQLTFLYVPTSVLYTNTTGGTIAGGILNVQVQCLVTGEIGNILAPDVLTVVNPSAGINPQANIVQSFEDGADLESPNSYRARLLSRIQNPPAGGNQTDYVNFAFAASNAVRSAFIVRFALGLGTVAIYITTGTNNLDYAVTNGLPVLRIPSSILLATVQAYYNTYAPLTDCPTVYAPMEINVNVTLNYVLANGLTLTSIPSDAINNPLNLNCGQLIQREIGRALYGTPIGGYQIPGNTNGFVTASSIEENLDFWLSAQIDYNTQLPIGIIPILADRQCQMLNSPHYDLPLLQNQLAAPGTLTLVSGV